MRGKRTVRTRSGGAALNVAGVHDDLANVMAVEEPAEEALEAKAVTTVGARAELALVREPVIGRRVNALTLVAGHELLHVPDTHRAADNLANARHENINRLGEAAILLAAGHVKRLDFGREAAEQNGLVDLVRHLALGLLGDVLAKLVVGAIILGDVVLAQVLNSVGIVHTAEGTLGCLEIGVELAQNLASGRVEDAVNNVADEILKTVQKIVKVDEWALGLNVRVLSKMAARARLLGAVRLRNAEDVAHGRNGRLKVELRGLRQVRRGTKEIEAKERRAALDLRLDKCGRRNLKVAIGEEVVAEALRDQRACLHHL
eukprot:m.288773 g.288773  ORF g.288773 m.288773 type:complete len:317 (-) comp12025_c0_seq1:761-1711(-)